MAQKHLFIPVVFSMLLVFCPYLSLKAQDDLKKYVNTLPPNVSSFEKYGTVPVSYNTGQVEQVIPLYDFEVDANVHIPIQLSYRNDGFKPDDVPTWVGHAWDLMPGGYIVQQINGIDDFLSYGMYDPATRQNLQEFMNGTMPEANRYDYVKRAVDGFGDTQQDVFSLNLLGHSVRFYFDGPQVMFIKYAPLKIALTSDKNFEVTDEKGYKYLFGLKTACGGSGMSDPTEYMALGGSTTWSLTTIIVPDGSRVELTYQADATYGTNSSSFIYRAGITGYSTDGNTCTPRWGGYDLVNSASGMSQQILQTISYKNRTINFNTIERNDLQTVATRKAKALSSIQVKNENSQLIRTINFSYDNNLRLKLSNVSILDNNTNAAVQRYSFEYYKYNNTIDLTEIPLITHTNRSYDFDHWGYFNGYNGNTSKGVPIADYGAIMPGVLNGFRGDNNRDANGEASKMGMLKRITYPTGGYTELEYEPNSTLYPTTNSVPVYLRNNIVTTPVYVPGSLGHATCPTYVEGVNGADEGTFVLSKYTSASLSWSWQSTVDDSQDYCSLTITQPDGSEIRKSGTTQAGSEMLYLAPGNYKWVLEVGCRSAQKGNTNFAHFFLNAYPDIITVTVGGNRIKKIKSYDAVTDNVMVQRFEYANPEFYQEPDYIISRDMWRPNDLNPAEPSNSLIYCGPQYIISAFNHLPHPGNVVYYQNVTEYLGENGENGKRVYNYGRQYWIGADYRQSPYPEITDLSWRGSALQSIDQYKKDGNGFTLLQNTATTYTDPPRHSEMYTMTKGIKIGIKGIAMNGYYPKSEWRNWYNQGSVSLPNDRFDKSDVTITEYTNDGNLVNKVNYSYSNNYFLPSRIQQVNSKGETIEKHFWYPGDFNSSIANMATLQANNMVGLPVKTVTTNNGNITSGEINDYDNLGNVTSIRRYENNKLASAPAHDPAVLYPTAFNPKLNLKYSGMRVKEFSPVDNMPSVILWGYNNSYPIAEVNNATYAEVVNVLGQQTVDQLNSNAPGTDEYVRTTLDLLRSNAGFKDKQVKTFTYQPMVGMTSQTDPQGRTTYYEYDGIGRLSLIKDHDKNVLKKFCYNYAGQQEGAGCAIVGNEMQTRDISRNNCGSGYVSTVVTYTVPAGTYYGRTVQEANQLALNDIDTKGQDYANGKGSCLVAYYNAPRSVMFTKNDCPAGEIGSQVLYEVPAGKHVATSQARADLLATVDIQANGQSYANSNGTCTENMVTFTANNNIHVPGFQATLTNTTTGKIYTVAMPPFSKQTISIPEGTYNVTVASGNTDYYINFYICNWAATAFDTAATFKNYYMSFSGCNSVTMDSID